jgi:hypothetical protein
MPARTLIHGTSFDDLRDEASFTLAALTPYSELRAYGKDLLATSKRIPLTQEQQYEVWEKQTMADAVVQHADDRLDDFTALLARETAQLENGIYDALFEQAPSTFVRPVLGGQLEAMRDWVEILEAHGLKARSKELVGLIKAAESALEQERKARMEGEVFRQSGPYKKLLETLNEVRDELFGRLDDHRREHRLPHSFPSRFFRQRKVNLSEAKRAEVAAKRAEALAKAKANQEALKAARARMKEVQAEIRVLKKRGR